MVVGRGDRTCAGPVGIAQDTRSWSAVASAVVVPYRTAVLPTPARLRTRRRRGDQSSDLVLHRPSAPCCTARRRHRDPQDPRALVVAMPHTAGASDLPCSAQEAEILRTRLHHCTVLTVPDADRDRVLGELTKHSWAHFACHGFSHPEDPSASHLLLQDHTTKPLTVLDISHLQLDDAELAYLSACSTARVGTTLTDEAIHLASASNWPASGTSSRPCGQSRTGSPCACQRRLRQHPWPHRECRRPAVHQATRRLRDRWPDHPQMWAAHIHTGA
jgi:CHAT domain